VVIFFSEIAGEGGMAKKAQFVFNSDLHLLNSLTTMDVNLRLEHPSVDRQGRRSTFHLIQPKITRCLPLYLAYGRQNAIE
jgi:hypothetical protein